MKINPTVYIAIGGVLLVGLFFIFKPKTTQTSLAPSPAIAQNNPTSSPELPDNIKTFELTIENKKITSGQSTLTVNEGDEIVIKITSSEPEEFHIHAYDNSVELEPRKQATLAFTAKISGRFPFELEKSKTELGALEVLPK